MTTVQTWTGRETRALRHALRMSIRDFAEHLGVSERTVSKWEAGRGEIHPRPEMQSALDTALSRAPNDAVSRFATTLEQDAPPGGHTGDTYRVVSHKFIPAYVGPVAAARLVELPVFATRPHEWLDVAVGRVSHANGRCTAHVYACGVVVLHVEQHLTLKNLTALATWRYTTYDPDRQWAGDRLTALLAASGADHAGGPEYLLSMYTVEEPAWRGDELDNALRLMSLPSVLVNQTVPTGATPADGHVERRLLAEGFEQPSLIPFGTHGVSLGYASWSGVSYYPIEQERSLPVDDLVSCELDVQMLWTYCRRIQREIEDGGDPLMPPDFGWRFLRAAHSGSPPRELGKRRSTA
ncbi:Helix-turn-helix domain-containing protein [Micromonospora echinospora]|uniref:Helix-turn-helix domain-containing protein n=1 Tax=Micromonospora echinospora TaxID=1877 RepID=A0A1C4V0X8_MICEC|nr:helix-turn-helix domain-containing protein [Micromonospora echinospora]SCE77546.1 Helix-turn-helix domain-containing protein [Micromonospora echinospora]